MFRTAATFFVILAILSLPLPRSIFAQSQVPIQEIGAAESSKAPMPDIKKAIEENNKKYAELSGKTDAKTMEKLERNRAQTQSGGMSGKTKLYIVLGVAAVAAFVFLVIKYGKDCKTTDPPNCSFGTDEPCGCTEYEQNLRPAR